MQAFTNDGLIQGIKAVLEQVRQNRMDEAKTEAELRRLKTEQVRHESEVRAWEGRLVWLKTPDAAERQVFCKRVGTSTLVIVDNGEEMTIQRHPDLRVRTPGERALAVLRNRVERVDKAVLSAMSRLTRLQESQVETEKEIRQLHRDVQELDRVRVSLGEKIRNFKPTE